MHRFVILSTLFTVGVVGTSPSKVSYSSAFQVSLNMMPRQSKNDSIIRTSEHSSPSKFSSRPLSPRSSKELYSLLYGTQEGVQQVRKMYSLVGPDNARSHYYEYSEELEGIRLANEHFLNIRSSARCGLPRPKIVRVKDFYPEPSKEFLPRCTILHRCDDESGCCDSNDFNCVPSAIQEVTLYFYIISLEKNGEDVRIHDSIEKLLFINHTECECQAVNDQPRSKKNEQEVIRISHLPTSTAASHEKHPISKCRDCPVPFHKREYPDGRCSCDCFDKEKHCLKVKKGKEPLIEVERRCVEVAHCHIPECEFGPYDYPTGRCVKRPDHLRKNTENRNYQNLHRWNFIERD